MNNIRYLSWLALFVSNTSFTFEINTHQALTRCAITTECNKKGAKNLHTFAKNNFFTENDYEEENFDGYGLTYFGYLDTENENENETEKGYLKWKIIVEKNYLGLVEAGSILEDAVWPEADPNDGNPVQIRFESVGLRGVGFLRRLCNEVGLYFDNSMLYVKLFV